MDLKDLAAKARALHGIIAQSVEVAKNKKPLEWIHLIPVGHWDYHWMLDGPFDITAEHIVQMEQNFLASQLDILVDYEHSSIFGSDSIAAGWVYEVEVRDTGLWGRVRWTQDALDLIAQEKYRYMSPFFNLDATSDKSGLKIGAKVWSTTLTNIPYFEEGLEQKIAASKEMAMDFMKKIAAMLGLPDTATEEQVLAAAQGLKGTVDAIVAALKDITPADSAAASKPVVEQIAAAKTMLVASKGARETLDAVLKELHVAATASTADVVEAIKNSRKDEGSLAAEVATLNGKVRSFEATTLVAEAQASGKIVAATYDWAHKFATNDPEGFKEWTKGAPAIPALKPPKPPTPNSDDIVPDEAEVEVASKMGIDPKKVAATRMKREAEGVTDQND